MTTVARTVHASDVDAWLGEIFGGEEAVSRAIDFTSSFITASNVLGDDPRLSITSWQDDGDHAFPVRRSTGWKPSPVAFPKVEEIAGANEDAVDAVESGPPDSTQVSHRQMRTHSVIREHLWNEAGWSGTVFVWTPEDKVPPTMAPMFQNAEAAQAIFEGWRREFGSADDEDRLRVSIVRGVNAAHPAWYRISIGSNLDSEQHAEVPGSVFLTMSRQHEMNASSPKNLEAFLQRYSEVGSYTLMPATLPPGAREPLFATRLGIKKTKLLVREAWQIGRHDLDAVMLKPDDNPVMPSDGRPAPVTELLQWLGSK